MGLTRYHAKFAICLLIHALLTHCLRTPVVHDPEQDVTYTGVCQNGIETFFSIPYGKDTSGEHRFKPPRPATPAKGSTIVAQSAGPACPQPRGAAFKPLYLTNMTERSEDCLHLNVYRPEHTTPDAKLPVMLFIHGGSFYIGSKDELVIQPGGLILRSVGMGHPVLFVTINYRLGVFGFAQSEALKKEGSENAGLRDQRLAIEWARGNIAHFGGDPIHITILGQSSGGLAIGMQILAYGGSREVPFQQASCESQALEPGITGQFTQNAMQHVVDNIGCNTHDLQSAAAVECLRALSTKELLNAEIVTHHDGPASNVGDQWLPVVDGDFVPEAPSKLIAERRFANVTTMIGWCENDGTYFVGNPKTNEDVFKFFSAYLPGFTTDNVHKLLSLYPVSDFSANPAAKLSAELYRAGRILRDILFACQPTHFGRALAEAGNRVYLWDQNQTVFDEILTYLGTPGYGVIHTSNFAYEFGNLSHYDVDGFPYHPNRSDFALRDRQSGSWASFANFGRPSVAKYNTLLGWEPAFAREGEVDLFVIGGPHEGLSAEAGSHSDPAVAAQKLKERCAFLNSPDVIKQLNY